MQSLPRNILDIIKSINMALDIKPKASDAELAAHIGVNDRDVAAVRKQRDEKGSK